MDIAGSDGFFEKKDGERLLSRVFRLWQREGLKVPVKNQKRRRLGMSANWCHRREAEGPNDVWCWDFVYDRTVSGSQLKWLSIVDEYTRECLALKVDRSITGEDVIDTLSELFAMRGATAYPPTVLSPLPTPSAGGLGRWMSMSCTSNRAAPGRTATPRASTVV